MNHENTIETINKFTSRVDTNTTITIQVGLISNKKNDCLSHKDSKISLLPCPIEDFDNYLFKSKGSEIYNLSETRCLVEEKGQFHFPIVQEYNSGFTKNCTSFNTVKLQEIRKTNSNVIAMV